MIKWVMVFILFVDIMTDFQSMISLAVKSLKTPASGKINNNNWTPILSKHVELCMDENSKSRCVQNTFRKNLVCMLIRVKYLIDSGHIRIKQNMVKRSILPIGFLSISGRRGKFIWNLHTPLTLGFNITFSRFEMAYSGAKCPYDAAVLTEIGAKDYETSSRYCGIRPKWTFISIFSKMIIVFNSYTNFPSTITLTFLPFNCEGYQYYTNQLFPNFVDWYDLTYTVFYHPDDMKLSKENFFKLKHPNFYEEQYYLSPREKIRHGNLQKILRNSFFQRIITHSYDIFKLVITFGHRYSIAFSIRNLTSGYSINVFEGPLFDKGNLLSSARGPLGLINGVGTGPTISVDITIFKHDNQLDRREKTFLSLFPFLNKTQNQNIDLCYFSGKKILNFTCKQETDVCFFGTFFSACKSVKKKYVALKFLEISQTLPSIHHCLYGGIFFGGFLLESLNHHDNNLPAICGHIDGLENRTFNIHEEGFPINIYLISYFNHIHLSIELYESVCATGYSFSATQYFRDTPCAEIFGWPPPEDRKYNYMNTLELPGLGYTVNLEILNRGLNDAYCDEYLQFAVHKDTDVKTIANNKWLVLSGKSYIIYKSNCLYSIIQYSVLLQVFCGSPDSQVKDGMASPFCTHLILPSSSKLIIDRHRIYGSLLENPNDTVMTTFWPSKMNRIEDFHVIIKPNYNGSDMVLFPIHINLTTTLSYDTYLYFYNQSQAIYLRSIARLKIETSNYSNDYFLNITVLKEYKESRVISDYRTREALDDKYVTKFSQKKSWDSAQKFCTRHGMTLWSLESSEELSDLRIFYQHGLVKGMFFLSKGSVKSASYFIQGGKPLMSFKQLPLPTVILSEKNSDFPEKLNQRIQLLDKNKEKNSFCTVGIQLDITENVKIWPVACDKFFSDAHIVCTKNYTSFDNIFINSLAYQYQFKCLQLDGIFVGDNCVVLYPNCTTCIPLQINSYDSLVSMFHSLLKPLDAHLHHSYKLLYKNECMIFKNGEPSRKELIFWTYKQCQFEKLDYLVLQEVLVPVQTVSNACLINQFRIANVCQNMDPSDCGLFEASLALWCMSHLYKCKNGQMVRFTQVCDYIDHCGDSSDEGKQCLFLACGEKYTCRSGQCIDKHLVCNGVYNCLDKSDEDKPFCHNMFLSGSKPIISNRYNRKTNDSITLICAPPFTTSSFNLDKLCLYDLNIYHELIPCKEGEHLQNCIEFQCTGYYKCKGAYCIPLRYLCNGDVDCPDGEDEQGCSTPATRCPSMFQCKNTRGITVCLPNSEICDGTVHCSDSSDERMCEFICPTGCICIGKIWQCADENYSFTVKENKKIKFLMSIPYFLRVSSRTFDFSNNLFKDLKLLDLQNTLENRQELPSFISSLNNLEVLDLRQNSIQIIRGDFFINLRNLEKLYLQNNTLWRLTDFSFRGLITLRNLSLSHQQLKEIDDYAFSGLYSLVELDLSFNKLSIWKYVWLKGLLKLIYFNLYGNEILQIEYISLPNSDTITFKMPYTEMCCMIKKFKVCNREMQNDLICPKVFHSNNIKLVTILLSSAVILLNLFSVSLKRVEHFNPYHLTQTYMSVLELLHTAKYLSIIAVHAWLANMYATHDKNLRSSLACKLLAAWSLTHYYVLLFCDCLLVFDQYQAVAKPFAVMKSRRFILKRIMLLICITCVYSVPALLFCLSDTQNIPNAFCQFLPLGERYSSLTIINHISAYSVCPLISTLIISIFNCKIICNLNKAIGLTTKMFRVIVGRIALASLLLLIYKLVIISVPILELSHLPIPNDVIMVAQNIYSVLRATFYIIFTITGRKYKNRNNMFHEI